MVHDHTPHYQTKYSQRLNFYQAPPESTVKVEDVELWALERLQVLKSLESALIRFKTEDDIRQAVEPTLHQYLPLASNHNRRAPLAAERRKDHISHFVLRLAFSKTAESRAWFLRFETALFRLRFAATDFQERQTFIEGLPNFRLHLVSAARKEALAAELRAASSLATTKSFDSEGFFEVDFEQVADLVQRRQVFLRAGKAYLPLSDQGVLVINEFKRRLEQGLQMAAKALNRMDEDDRLAPILDNLSSQQVSMEYQTKSMNGQITAADVDKEVHHFPPCMRHLQGTLAEQGHMRHSGRIQYGLFLKGIGVSIEEAMVYWRRAFRHLSDDKFQKEYAYNIRHMYGLEGKRTNYSPYSCNKIITSNHPGPGDNHGCPFRHFSKEQLITSLQQQKLGEEDIGSITELSDQGHCQLACTRHFEITHRARLPTTGASIAVERIIHPNQYYDQSVALVTKE